MTDYNQRTRKQRFLISSVSGFHVFMNTVNRAARPIWIWIIYALLRAPRKRLGAVEIRKPALALTRRAKGWWSTLEK